KQAPLTALIEEAAAPHSARGVRIVLRLDGKSAEAQDDPPIVLRRPELIHGLRNLIQNAVDFAASTVWIDVERGGERLVVSIADDGPGFGADVLPRLGEPFVSTRSRDGRRGNPTDGYEGMGLGLFIARTLLERTGAELQFRNAPRGAREANRAAGLRSAASRVQVRGHVRGEPRRRDASPRVPAAAVGGAAGVAAPVSLEPEPDDRAPASAAPPIEPTGAIAVVSWPQERFLQSKAESRRALGQNEPANSIP
ncbi:MAG: ATP-binding protein, partial [Pseudomonadota bacterium]